MGAGVCKAFKPEGTAWVPGRRGSGKWRSVPGRARAWHADSLDFQFQFCHLLAEILGKVTQADILLVKGNEKTLVDQVKPSTCSHMRCPANISFFTPCLSPFFLSFLLSSFFPSLLPQKGRKSPY